MTSKNWPFWILAISIFIGLIVPVLIQDGMFMDGQQYAIVAKNLSDGLGSFWFPYLSQTWFKAGSPFFMEHPPLIYGIQSLFFTALGSSIYVERFYSFCTAVISAWIIVVIWRTINSNNVELKKIAWLPIVLWIIIPVCFWSYQNDMNENTMGIFTLLSIWFSIKGNIDMKASSIWIIFSGLAIFLASFSKGVPGLFPIAVPFLFWISTRNISFKKVFIQTFILVLVPVVIYSLLMLNEEASKSLSFYFNERLIQRVNDEPTVNSRFFILGRLFSELIPVIVLTASFLVIFKLKRVQLAPDKRFVQYAVFFFLIGLSGSLPLLITTVQRGFYFVPSLPFFAISFSLLIANGINELLIRWDERGSSFKMFKIMSLISLIIVISFSYSKLGSASRDKDELHDIYFIGKVVPPNTIIRIDQSLQNEWSTQFYLLRKFNISSDASDVERTYYLRNKNMSESDNYGYRNLNLNTKKFDLFILNNEANNTLYNY